jgi:hypothetical protein
MPFFTLQITSKRLVPSGVTGHFPWNVTVAGYNLHSEADAFHMLDLIVMWLMMHT